MPLNDDLYYKMDGQRRLLFQWRLTCAEARGCHCLLLEIAARIAIKANVTAHAGGLNLFLALQQTTTPRRCCYHASSSYTQLYFRLYLDDRIVDSLIHYHRGHVATKPRPDQAQEDRRPSRDSAYVSFWRLHCSCIDLILLHRRPR